MFTAYETLKAIVKIYSALFAKSEVHGCHPLPAGPKIIAVNHTLASDGFQIPLVIKEKLYFLTQADLFTLPILGRLLQRSGQIPVESGDYAAGASIRQALRILREGKTVVIFPEGSLVPPGERIPAKTGVIRLALHSAAPIIPLGIYVLPKNITAMSMHRLGEKRHGLWQTSGTCHLRFGAPWLPCPSRYDKAQILMLTEELMNKIYTLVAETEKELACVSPGLFKPAPQL